MSTLLKDLGNRKLGPDKFGLYFASARANPARAADSFTNIAN
jgi:hypothetical protein